MAVGDTHVFPGFLSLVLTQLFFPKPLTTFLTCFCRGERRKYAGKKVGLIRGSNSQLSGHETDTLTTELTGWGLVLEREKKCCWEQDLENMGIRKTLTLCCFKNMETNEPCDETSFLIVLFHFLQHCVALVLPFYTFTSFDCDLPSVGKKIA